MTIFQTEFPTKINIKPPLIWDVDHTTFLKDNIWLNKIRTFCYSYF